MLTDNAMLCDAIRVQESVQSYKKKQQINRLSYFFVKIYIFCCSANLSPCFCTEFFGLVCLFLAKKKGWHEPEIQCLCFIFVCVCVCCVGSGFYCGFRTCMRSMDKYPLEGASIWLRWWWWWWCQWPCWSKLGKTTAAKKNAERRARKKVSKVKV